ncbi:uncharacterized protein F5Z01DRAFT_690735 [Emericellopsis atlantica]|uniref:Uncharacterized protein n=1 Tax=Emericellopsis atlantica TaxID=2614577 RepID=A0A9P7ZJ85_9HYPO|nr:uncharacterized protein F5Z01DRAFT_690735 [Emericellopsis atlantica]KAG9252483.1 hypothetical protein F5Z01DRAFT_690735 [Emericellopsis atlantica]
MPLTILGKDDTTSLIESLTPLEIHELRMVLSAALHEFSVNPRAGGHGTYQQPRTTTIRHEQSEWPSALNTACGPEGTACKGARLTSSSSVSTHQHGSLSLYNTQGELEAILSTYPLTPFITALSSVCLLSKRSRPIHTLVVFGAGQQAYYHIRLALKVHGHAIKKVHVVNHRFSDTAANFLRNFSTIPRTIKHEEGWEHAEFGMLTPAFHDYHRLLTEQVLEADVIYLCTPSQEPLFPGDILTSHEGRRKGRFIIAVGSTNPHQREIPAELVAQAVKVHEKPHRHFHKHADEGGVVIVDSLEGGIKHAGEIVHGGVKPSQLVELGELVMLQRMAESDAESTRSQSTDETSLASANSQATSSSSKTNLFSLPHRKKSNHDERESALARWLGTGTVVYKSVGLPMMDLVVANLLVKLADGKAVGTKAAF